MKKIIFFLLIAITGCVSQQPLHHASELSQTKIIEIKDTPAKKLYIAANDWMIDTFNSAESVIQYSDKESGTIIGKYLLGGSIYYQYGSKQDTRLFAKIKIEIKENKVRINITPMTDFRGNERQTEITKQKIIYLIKNFENKILTENKDNW